VNLDFKPIGTFANDCDYLLELKSNIRDVYWSGYVTPPQRDKFILWFKKQLMRSDRKIWLVRTPASLVVGYLYITLNSRGKSADLSHGVAITYIGRGIGSQIVEFAISHCHHKYPDLAINAWVLDENIGSAKTFLKNGFNKMETQKKVFYESFGKEVILYNYKL